MIPLKAAVDEALQTETSVRKVFVFRHAKNEIQMKAGLDIDASNELDRQSEHHKATPVDSEHPLFILYTSGSTGKPKGVLHSTAGYMVYTALTTKTVFDLKNDDIYWCSADVGWITGHSYVTYGPLLNAATVFLYEGAPDFPAADRFWQMIDRHQISIFYTAPTAIRAFMKWGDSFVDAHRLESLRLLGSVGEPINPEAWKWYFQKIGKSKCPIVDTWWQTETGGIMITTIPGVHAMKPGSAGKAFFGVEAQIVDPDGKNLGPNEGGFLTIKNPWPSMIRDIHGDSKRYQEQYWEKVEHQYFAGDGARVDEDGYFWIMGRIDDVVNISGHRLGTAEVESALVSHPSVCEAAVVGVPDPVTGERIFAFVVLESSQGVDPDLEKILKQHVAKEIGALARPSEIRIVDSLPKTRSGKIMRRLLRAIASGNEVAQDTSTLEDQGILEKLRS